MSVLRGEHWNPYVYSWVWLLLMLSARLHLSIQQAVCIDLLYCYNEARASVGLCTVTLI